MLSADELAVLMPVPGRSVASSRPDAEPVSGSRTFTVGKTRKYRTRTENETAQAGESKKRGRPRREAGDWLNS